MFHRLALLAVFFAVGQIPEAFARGSYPVCIEGTLKDSFRDPLDSDYQVLYVQATNIHYYVFLRTHSEQIIKQANDLIGGKIRIRGLQPAVTTGLSRPFSKEVRLKPPHHIEVLRPPPADLFSAAYYTNLFGMATDDIGYQDVKTARGRVLAVWNGNNILLKTRQEDIILVTTRSTALPSAGDLIEVAGLPESTLYSLQLNRAVWRASGSDQKDLDDESAETATAEDFVTDEKGRPGIRISLHGKVVKIKGEVCSLPRPESGDNILYLACAGHIIPVNTEAISAALQDLTPGCTVEVRGICVVDSHIWRPNSGIPYVKIYSIVTRSPDDIRMLARPPWLTTGKMMIIIGLLTAIIVGILIWNTLLRLASEQRGKELAREQVKSLESDLKVQERTRLAVELHDSLAQDLGGLALEVKSALEVGNDNPEEATRHLQVVDKALQSCNTELHHCLWDLRSHALDEPDLNTAILRTLQPHVHNEQVVVRCNFSRSLLPDHTTYTMLRIVRELVLNAIRHGRARHIRIAGSLEKDKLLFSVADDGAGFDPDLAPGVLQGHFGLEGIRERTEQMGGSFELDSTPGRGTKAVITLSFSEQS